MQGGKASGIITITLTLVLSYLARADAINRFLPMPPRVFAQVTQSNITIFHVDSMLPLLGNDEHILYVDGVGSYGNNAWLGSFGFGIRNIVNINWLVGGYLFADWNKSDTGSNFNVLNPGFELMHNNWDFHLNAYFPLNDNKFKGFNIASNVGCYRYIYFHEHSEFDNLLATNDIVGKGGDFEVGYLISAKKPIRLFIGSYLYFPKGVSDIHGILGGLELTIRPHIKLILQNAYDDVFHNTAAISLRLSFNKLKSSKPNRMADRILDPIERHLGILNSGSGVLNQRQIVNTGKKALVDNNIWFFSPGIGGNQIITTSSCTFEHPCIGLSQAIINGINDISPSAKLFLSPGSYINKDIGNGFTLNDGQSVFGRSNDYSLLAQGSNRALVEDTLLLYGNNTVSHLQIDGNSTGTVNFGSHNVRSGIVINQSASGVVQLNHLNVNVSTTKINEDAAGIFNLSPRVLVIMKHSKFFANAISRNSSAVGVINKGNIDISFSNLHGITSASRGLGAGLYNEDFGEARISNSTLEGKGKILAEGVFNEDFGRVTLSNSLVKAVSDELSEGIFNEDFGHINILNSRITANSGNISRGIFNEDFGRINLTNSTIIAAAPISAIGIFNQDYGQVIIRNTRVVP